MEDDGKILSYENKTRNAVVLAALIITVFDTNMSFFLPTIVHDFIMQASDVYKCKMNNNRGQLVFQLQQSLKNTSEETPLIYNWIFYILLTRI